MPLKPNGVAHLGSALFICALCATSEPWPSAAQDLYPARPITMIVPYAAGGPSDTIARLTADHLSRTLGKQIVVENVGGAGGTLGAERAARATPDGYTILQHHAGLPASASLYNNLKYDVSASFEPVGLINSGPMVLTSRKTLDLRNAKELLAWLKERGEKASVAQGGPGSNSHMCALLIMQSIGGKVGLVPYRGTGPAMIDLVAGQIDVLCDQALTAAPQVLSSNVKAYLVTSKERLPMIKDVPTAIEAGVANFDMVVWNGMYVPRGTPERIVSILNNALQAFLGDPIVIERFAQTGYTPFLIEMRSLRAHREFLLSEIGRYKAMVSAAGVRPEEPR